MKAQGYGKGTFLWATLVALVIGLIMLSACQNQTTPTTTPAPGASQPTAGIQSPTAGPSGTPSAQGGGASFSDQNSKGQGIFAQRCAKCHGQKGEGVTAPAVTGPNAGLAVYGDNAGQLFSFIKTYMPQDNPGTLADDDAWAVLAYILNQNGLYQGPKPLGTDNAASVSVKR